MVQKTIPLPLSAFQLQDGRASSKLLVGCYPEVLEQDSQDDSRDNNVAALRRWPGITNLATFSGNLTDTNVRGLWEMQGTVYAVVGSVLYAISSAGAGTWTQLSGAGIPGDSFVRMTDNGACLVILVPETNFCFTYCPNGGGFQQLTSSFFTAFNGAIDCWYVDSYIVFLANNNNGKGSYTFFNDDGRVVSGNNQITFTTAASFSRQFGTDPFYCMAVDHREIVCFGSRSTEGYVNTGNPVGTPFSAAPDTFMPIGVHINSPYSAALQDNSIIWLANDLTFRRRNGQTPQRISNSGVEMALRLINQAGNLKGSYALCPTWDGHPFYIFVVPAAARTFAYDCTTQKWTELNSVVNGVTSSWRPLCYYNAFGLQLVGDTFSPVVGYLDGTNTYELDGGAVPCEIITQPVYAGNRRLQHRRLEAVVTPGTGVQGQEPAAAVIDLLASDNFGLSFESFSDQQDLGQTGDTTARAQWYNLGQSRSRVYMLRITDAAPTFTVDLQLTYEPATN